MVKDPKYFLAVPLCAHVDGAAPAQVPKVLMLYHIHIRASAGTEGNQCNRNPLITCLQIVLFVHIIYSLVVNIHISPPTFCCSLIVWCHSRFLGVCVCVTFVASVSWSSRGSDKGHGSHHTFQEKPSEMRRQVIECNTEQLILIYMYNISLPYTISRRLVFYKICDLLL